MAIKNEHKTSIDDLLSKGEIVQHRSPGKARELVPELRRKLGLSGSDGELDNALEDFITQVVLGAAWYAKRYRHASWKVWWYIVVNGAIVLGLPLGLIALGAAAKALEANVAASQVTGVLTGVLALQKTLSAWYASQQRYAAWYKAGSDLKTIYYTFVGRWADKGRDQRVAMLADCEAQTSAARHVIDDERLDFYQRLALPSFDILDMLTGTRSAVSSFVTNLLPSGSASQVTVIGRNAILGSPGGAPIGAASTERSPAAATSASTGVILRSPGSAKPNDNPYTIVFVANPALEILGESISWTHDPIVLTPQVFENAVDKAIGALFGKADEEAENFMEQFDGQIRIVSIFDSSLSATSENALVQVCVGIPLVPVQARFRGFLARYNVRGRPLVADVAIAVTSAPDNNEAGSYPTRDDDENSAGTSFLMDGTHLVHRYENIAPGVTALHSTSSATTVLHEFGHSASSWSNGSVVDLYNDGLTRWPNPVNIRKGRPIPSQYGTYSGGSYAPDLTRDHIGYGSGWTSFHCELLNPSQPCLMDDYTQAGDQAIKCRHDKITAAFLTDRIRALTSRP